MRPQSSRSEGPSYLFDKKTIRKRREQEEEQEEEEEFAKKNQNHKSE
jgi:hypothetical protein